ncbi:MAG TPA: AAA family ATPase [Lacibacter sp.]|nr:AAA family ATPase [Lacibacter sp.]HMO88196.1 AAA family ATPase [Lacibacter sp.]HMP87995.1 AAA family ATPase [Lacibacter sp.]
MTAPRRFIQVLAGPRQTGKTTLVQQLAHELADTHHYCTADAEAAAGTTWLRQQWETARLLCKQRGASAFVLMIDEVQKIDNWSETVKLLWDSDTNAGLPIQVILLGSSRMLMQQGLTESLAGRFEMQYVGHWSLVEMKAAFDYDAETYTWYGGYPGSAALRGDELRWKQYVRDALIEPCISKDVLQMTRVDKPALLRRLFELGCLYSGQVLSYTKLMGQLQDAGNTTTLAHYLHLLDTAGLLGGLDKYSAAVVRQRSSSPRFQVHNTALMSAQSPYFFHSVQRQPELWGRWVESAVGAHLLNAAYAGSMRLYYWRERNNEVDFILEKEGRCIALEVKTGSEGLGRGMEAFAKQFHPHKTLLIGDGGLPWQVLLETNPVDLF